VCCPGCFCLTDEQQMLLTGLTTKITKQGAGCYCVGGCWKGQPREGYRLTKTEYMIISNLDGTRELVVGPIYYFLGAYQTILREGGEDIRKAITLDKTEYIFVKNTMSGQVEREQGPKQFFPPTPYHVVGRPMQATALKRNEYITILDHETGNRRVERGEQQVFLTPFEEILDEGVQTAVNIDEHTAVLVRNIENGQQYLITEKMLFFPSHIEKIMEIQKKVVLKDHETCIILDKDGYYHFMSGPKVNNPPPENEIIKIEGKKEEEPLISIKTKETVPDSVIPTQGGGRAFFIPPYCNVLSLEWSTGPDTKEFIDRVDSRPRFLNTMFICRSSDNVELAIKVTFFWQVVDVRKMIKKTDDAPGDICIHARSVTIQAVSKLTMEEFMQNFNHVLSTANLQNDDPFYVERGIIIHRVEVDSYHCKDSKTETILQEIIKERTDRLNKKQKQESDNEVRLYKMRGQIEEEKLHGELLKIRHDHHRAEAAMEGEAEADQLRMFLEGLEEISNDKKFLFWSTLRKLDALKFVSQAKSTLYYTPDDIDLSLGSWDNPWDNKDKSERTIGKKKE